MQQLPEHKHTALVKPTDVQHHGQEALLAEGDAMWAPNVQARTNAVISGRAGLLERQQPGVAEALLVFCDQRGAAAYRFPWYQVWAPLVEPLITEVRS